MRTDFVRLGRKIAAPGWVRHKTIDITRIQAGGFIKGDESSLPGIVSSCVADIKKRLRKPQKTPRH